MKNKLILKIILSILIIIVLLLPIFIFVNIENKNKAYDSLIQELKDSAMEYINKNNISIDNQYLKVKLGDLKHDNLIDNIIINPKTKKYLSNESYVLVNKTTDTYDVYIYDIPNNENSAGLIITFYGDRSIQNGITVQYYEQGISLIEGNQEIDYSVQYFTKGKEVNEIDSSRPRDYEVVYTALNSKGELAKVVRTVIVQ